VKQREEIVTAEENARRKWKDSGDPVWAYAEAALAWARGSTNVDPKIQEILEGMKA